MAAEIAAETSGEEPDDAISRLSQWITTLPAHLQELYELVYVRGYSQRAAAVVMHVSQPRIAQLHRALLRRGIADISLRAA